MVVVQGLGILVKLKPELPGTKLTAELPEPPGFVWKANTLLTAGVIPTTSSVPIKSVKGLRTL